MDQGKIILITGGSRSGKSEYAEDILKEYNKILYIATAIITDEEMQDRIKKHRERRGERYVTYEGYKELDKILGSFEEEYVLLDCVTTMVTNLMFDKNIDFDKISMDEADKLQTDISKEFDKLIKAARKLNKTLVMVTNEVGSGLVPEYRLSRIFRDAAGTINQNIAKLSDEVYLVACGLPIKLK